jgi:phosphate transport system permease protein
MLSNKQKLIQKRTRKESFFKRICGLALVLYMGIILLFAFIVIKSGINAFLVTKIKVHNMDQLSDLKSIISNTSPNKPRIDAIKSGLPQWLETKGNFSMYYKSRERYNENWNQIISSLKKDGHIRQKASFTLLTNTDSSIQENAGLLGAIKGTLFVTLIFLGFATITGIATGIYLFEFSRNKTLKNIISINISNLASVPPIIYGIFGLNFFVNFLAIPRSSSLLGGLILGILTLPIIVIVTTDSLKSVPLHLKFSAKALGLTHMQTVLRICVPYAFPRILTGILLTLSRGISEATPLILIGMASFIKVPPSNLLEPSTTIATQIYLWLNSPDGSFIEKAYGSIFVLLLIIGIINLCASFVRYKVMKRTSIR